MSREVAVYMDIDGKSHRVGKLWARATNGRESASFEYDKSWLRSPDRFALEPALQLGEGAHHTAAGRRLFGAFGDSAPDRWGRMLMKRRESKAAQKEGRTQRTLLEIDYLLMVDDFVRQGALRFCDDAGNYLAADPVKIPLLIALPRLLAASDRLTADKETDEDLKLLFGHGSSLGGARPKASIIDRDGSLAIAKFPHMHDEYRIELWSHVVLTLAKKAGIRVAGHRLEIINGKHILITSRFDRSGEKRIAFLSAMSMIGAADGDIETRSYLELADAIRKYGAASNQDLQELWRRILFSILVSNADDHLRNHGYLFDSALRGWRLSPAYDMNPVPRDLKAGFLSLLIDESSNEMNFDVLAATGNDYGMDAKDMRRIVQQTVLAVAGWRKEAKAAGASTAEIERMASAFEHQALADAQNFAKNK